MSLCFILFILSFQQPTDLERIQERLTALEDRLPMKPVTQQDLEYFERELNHTIKERDLQITRQIIELDRQIKQPMDTPEQVTRVLTYSNLIILAILSVLYYRIQRRLKAIVI